MTVPAAPGNFYIGHVAAIRHHVAHEGEDNPDELLEFGGEFYNVAVMVRTSCFAAARARTQASPPGPSAVYNAVREAVHSCLGESGWRVPQLHDILQNVPQEDSPR